ARQKDLVRIEAGVRPPGYVYILGFGQSGKAQPLYPWEHPGKWGTRPARETPVEHLVLPRQVNPGGDGWEIEGREAGMMAFVMLVRAEPLDLSDDDLRALVDGLPPPRPLPSAEAAVWLENGLEVRDEPKRRTRDFLFDERKPINNPVYRLQAL